MKARILLFLTLALCFGFHQIFAQDFVLSSTNAVGINPTYIAVADVNGDGQLDLASANFYGHTLTVLTNNGNGTFTFSATLALGAEKYPNAVVAADMNGDGMLDLITANDDMPGTLTVLTNNGNGAFTLSATLPVASNFPWSVVAADVNGDGKLDLISANRDFPVTLSVLTNNGSGVFGPNATYSVGKFPAYVVAADANGDGKLDLISANTDLLSDDAGTLEVLTNNGSGVFGSNATYTVGRNPASVVAVDVNGDGKLDLISANWNDSSLSVLTNNWSGGFVSNATYTVGSNAASVVAADVNGDGKLDLVSANFRDNTLTVLTNNGDGMFTFSFSLGVGNTSSAPNPSCVVATDVNGDGKPDLISANWNDNTLAVLVNSPAPPLLNIQPTSTNTFVLFWSAAWPGFALQQNSDLGTTNWVGVTNSINAVGGVNQAILPPPPGDNYFRLLHQ